MYTSQFVMNGLRLGSYSWLDTAGWTRDSDGRSSVARTAACSAVAGVLGAVAGSPVFLVKTHLQVREGFLDIDTVLQVYRSRRPRLPV